MSIIQQQTINLEDNFDAIQESIQTNKKFSNLKKKQICSFNNQQKTLTFKTEKIHPIDYPKGTKPVILLFSNPHPLSVNAGIFLSEPSSQAFWKRLFHCECLHPDQQLEEGINEWSDDTIDILTKQLLSPTYSNKITLFFDCLEALPTDMYSHLATLLPNRGKTKGFRKKALQAPGKKQLIKISEENDIDSWIVFSVEAYRNLVGDENIGKNAPKRISKAIDEYLTKQDNGLFWDQLNDLKKTVTIEGKKINLYLSLIARYKHTTTKTGKYYFTIMLDQIMNDIISS